MGVQGVEVYGLGEIGCEAGRLDLRHPHAPNPYPQRTHMFRLLGPKTPLYTAFLGYFDAKGKVKQGESQHNAS